MRLDEPQLVWGVVYNLHRTTTASLPPSSQQCKSECIRFCMAKHISITAFVTWTIWGEGVAYQRVTSMLLILLEVYISENNSMVDKSLMATSMQLVLLEVSLKATCWLTKVSACSQMATSMLLCQWKQLTDTDTAICPAGSGLMGQPSYSKSRRGSPARLVGRREHFLQMTPKFMGLSYVTEIPNIMGLSYGTFLCNDRSNTLSARMRTFYNHLSSHFSDD